MAESRTTKTVYVIVGPTASGKTGVAIEIASKLDAEIISADSRQCFKELRIGVARPTAQELQKVKHHFIASHSIHDDVTAAYFGEFALQKTTELFENGDTVVMAGGTGLYVRAFCEGLDEIPAIDPAIRKQITESYSHNGLAWLQQEVRLKDPDFFATGEIKNPQRLMRALEVVEGTGQSIVKFRMGTKEKRPFQIVRMGLDLPKEELLENIRQRADRMIDEGLVEEVESLSEFKHLNALQTVGYTEIFNYLNGQYGLEEAIAKIKTNTWQYAKRQRTWFKRDPEIHWFDPRNISMIHELVSKTRTR